VSEALAQAGEAFFAPDCIYYEVAATLSKYDRIGAYHGLAEDLQKLFDLPIVATSCKDLMQAAAMISRDHLVSLCDAFYVALSQIVDAPLITTNEGLANGIEGKGFDVRHVSDL
jgi:predicted nucleic acid-binding protein